MARSSGAHLKWHEVKAEIIEFIISSNEAVREPAIREHLRTKYGIVDQGNIKTHLNDLQLQFSCIEKIPPKKPGDANKWEVRRIEQIRNIRSHFSEIQLKKYEKPLKIILKRFFPLNQNSPMANKFRIQLLLSNSYFDMCMKTYPETVDTIAFELYKHGFDKWGKEYPEWEQRILEDMSRGRAVEMFTIMMKEILPKLNIPKEAETLKTMLETEVKKIKGKESKMIISELNIPKRLEISTTEIIKTVFETKTKKIKDEESELMSYWYQVDKSGEIFEMKLPLYIRPALNEIMFELCFQIDIKDGTVSPEEIEFVNETKKMRAHYKVDQEISLFSELQEYDTFYVKYFEKYRQDIRTR